MTGKHNPNRAWALALAYFALCWLAAALSGTLDLVSDQPMGAPGRAGEPGLWVAAVAVAALTWVGYWVVWPKGTTTEGRPPYRVSSMVYGVLDGASEGLLYLTAWHLVTDSWGRSIPTFLLLFVGIAGYNALWRNLVWDVWVTPVHNIEEWNTKKIVWVHAPALSAGLAHLMVFEAVAPFIVFETIALVGSAVHMRFPAPGSGRWSS